jgi:hypothetical protein
LTKNLTRSILKGSEKLRDNWIKKYANAFFYKLERVRTEYGRWEYTVPSPNATLIPFCRVSQGDRLVEGVLGNVRALTVLTDCTVKVEVDDRLHITMADTEINSPTGMYAVIGVQRSGLLGNAMFKTQLITCIEAAQCKPPVTP